MDIMTEQKEKRQPRSRVKKGSSNFLFAALTFLVLAVIGIYFFVQKSPSSPFAIDGDSTRTETGTPQTDSMVISQLPLPDEPGELSGSEAEGNTLSTQSGTLPREGGPEQIGQLQPDKDEYQFLIDELNIFYTHLDQQPYMQDFILKEPSKVHFSKVLQKLVDNPPVVTRETDDLFTLLKNTAHFFRILGKDNIIILKGILDREKDSFEEMLKTFYTLTHHPDYLKEEYSLTIPSDALYDYAGFFLNTMGGRLYLFRRDSTSRLAVSYYAILVIDRANDEGRGRHGIDIKPAIDSLIEEIENGGNRLRLKEEYLDKLYDLKEKYS
jgi:hypothetical protein